MKTKNKNLLLVILLIAVVGMAIGYAALSQQLVINGTANITTEWDVHIEGITASSDNAANGATDTTTPTYTATSATFDVNLAYPGASASYTVYVKNGGTIGAKLQDVTGVDTANSAEPTGITYTIDANANDTLASGSTRNYTVTVTWDADATQIPETKTKTATITLNYVQAD